MTQSREEETCAVSECDRGDATWEVMDWSDGEPETVTVCNPCGNAYRMGIRAERETVDMP